MSVITRRQFMKAVAAAGTLTAISGMSLSSSACFETTAPADGFSQKVVIDGFAWGPGVTATILEVNQLVRSDSVHAEDFSVTESKDSFSRTEMSHIVVEAPRTVTAAYTCSKNGSPVHIASRYIRLELACNPRSGSPFCYDMLTKMNAWCAPYGLKIELNDGASLMGITGNVISTLNVNPTVSFDDAIISSLEPFDMNGVFTGTDGRTLHYASYKPAAPFGKKLPLVIWLHGAGEGGTDPSILLLGNEVSVLAKKEFQDAFGGAAYILTPQTSNFWLEWDENAPETWNQNPGAPSVYTQTLKELIDSFVAENPNVDANRIVIGGCSNGGYMAFNMAMRYPDYFAAAYPICEAYNNAGITDTEIEAVKDLPLWFVYAQNDTTVRPENFESPTLERLAAIGANVHTSIFADVHDTSGLYHKDDGSAYQYPGHWSWIYFFHNECVDDVTGENMWNWLGKQSK